MEKGNSEQTVTMTVVGDKLELKDQLRDYQLRGNGLSSLNFLEFTLNTYEGDYKKKNGSDGDVIDNAGTSRRPGRPRNDRHKYLEQANKGNRCRIVRTNGHETLPKISGSWFNRSDRPNKADLHRACMLALLKPWRTLNDIKRPSESFDAAYTEMLARGDRRTSNFVANAQYFYECTDSAKEEETANLPPIHMADDGSSMFLPNVPRHGNMEQETPITEEDIDLARKLRIHPREILFGEAAIDKAYKVGIFTENPPITTKAPVAPHATTEMIDKIKSWDTQLKTFTKDMANNVILVDNDDGFVGNITAGINLVNQHSTSTSTHVRPSTTLTEIIASRSQAERPKLQMLRPAQRRAHDMIENVLQQERAGQ